MNHSHHGHMDHLDTMNQSLDTTTMMLANITSQLVSTASSMLVTTKDDMEQMMHNGPKSSHQHTQDMEMEKTMGMQMWFYVSQQAIILFKEWDVNSVGGMVGSVIGIICLSILYEGLKFFREHLFRLHYSRLSYSTCAVTGGNCSGAELNRVSQNRLLSLAHLTQTGLHIVQIVLSYFLMLIFMTYNVWLCLAVVIGSGIGYFFFGWKKSTVVDVSDHCH